jgi:hypothetical protein
MKEPIPGFGRRAQSKKIDGHCPSLGTAADAPLLVGAQNRRLSRYPLGQVATGDYSVGRRRL